MKTEKLIGIGAAGAVAMGLGVTGASLASADDSPTSESSSTSSTTTPSQSGEPGKGAQDGQERKARVDDGRELTADAASKAISAAEAKESGATAKGVHLGRDGGYEVMMLRADGTMVEVVLDDGFTVTDVEERTGRGPGGHGGPGGRGGPHGGSQGESQQGESQQGEGQGQQGQGADSGDASEQPSSSSTAN